MLGQKHKIKGPEGPLFILLHALYNFLQWVNLYHINPMQIQIKDKFYLIIPEQHLLY
jgi:hypothetical protein